MELGIFARTFSRSSFEETLDAVLDHGLAHVQFNLSCAGLPTLPETMNLDRCARIARCFRMPAFGGRDFRHLQHGRAGRLAGPEPAAPGNTGFSLPLARHPDHHPVHGNVRP